MRGLMLGNIDYEMHMTDEGDQFQKGLQSAGWTLAGAGYGDGERDVAKLLERHNPTHVIVHDKRDWSRDSRICFRDDIEYENLGVLRDASAWVGIVVKDAATFRSYTEAFAEEVDADSLIVYYDKGAVDKHSGGWTRAYNKIRTYHSVDADLCGSIVEPAKRKYAMVSGAVGRHYWLRSKIFLSAKNWGIDPYKHPGYGNSGSATEKYLRLMARYKVHVATASNFGFALRKIIESVAMGCTPVTNLPPEDVLPHIDGALVRVPAGMGLHGVREVIYNAARNWDYDERMKWARLAWSWYDWRSMGCRLSANIAQGSELAVNMEI